MNDPTSAMVVDEGTAAWERVLGDYARSLDEHRAALTFIEADLLADGPVPSPPEFIAPATLPILPAELAPRAGSLIEITDGLVAWAAELSARAQLQVSTRPARVSAPVRSRWEASL